jgi:acetamidase/formamidase
MVGSEFEIGRQIQVVIALINVGRDVMDHSIELVTRNLQGCFSRDRRPILTISSGDTLTCQTLDAGWGLDPFADDVMGKRIPLAQRPDPANDTGHCLVGPIAVRGAQPGQVLQVDICHLVPASVGATWVGEVQEFLPQLGVDGHFWLPWQIDVATGLARSSSGHQVPLAPFLGVLGVAPAMPGIHATRPPRAGGGNIDCKDLTMGSTLLLPIQVPDALFSFGDGHAAQGDGEVGGTAIECGMGQVQLRLTVRDDISLVWPQARTSAGWLTFGFAEDLTAATIIALNGMLDIMMQQLAVSRQEALALASVGVHLRVTQIANRTLGVHALWPNTAFR